MEPIGVKIELISPFLVIKETLERIGVYSRPKKIITPSCYILHIKGEYYISHFKFLLSIDGFKKEISEVDINRQNAIITLLQNWNMIRILDDNVYQDQLKEKIYVLPYKLKKETAINHKFCMKNLTAKM